MGVLDGVASFLGFRSRALNEDEVRAARGVFEGTIPYRRVVIDDWSGVGGAPYTVPGPGDTYIMHLGADGYASTAGMQATLIHELVHVWQGANHIFNGYVPSSLLSQGRYLITTGNRDNAYRYSTSDLGRRSWHSYNVEQQASIVEDWFTNGRREDDPRFPYIRNNIRHPIQSWAVENLTKPF